MKTSLNPLKRWIDDWAKRRVVRVAVFGHGPSTLEWESLQTTAYAKLVPRLKLVLSPREAHILALHGPFTTMNWSEVAAWVQHAAPGAQVVLIGDEGELVGDRLKTPYGGLSEFRVSVRLNSRAPAPAELQAAISCLLESPHV
jgi:Ni,Fe-hydrogenase III small subunit